MGQSLAEYPLPEEGEPMKVDAGDLDSVVLIPKGYESEYPVEQEQSITEEVQGLAEKLGVKESSVESLLTPLFMQDSYPMPDGEEPTKVEAGELEYVVLAPEGYEGNPQEGGMNMTEEVTEDQNMSENSQELSELKEEVEDMANKNEKLQDEKQELAEKLNDYEETVEQLEQEKEELQEKVDEYEEKLEQRETSERRSLAEDIMEIRKKKGLVDDDCDQKMNELTEMSKDALNAILSDLKEVSEKLSEPQPKVKEDVEEEEHKNADKKEALRAELFGDK